MRWYEHEEIKIDTLSNMWYHHHSTSLRLYEGRLAQVFDSTIFQPHFTRVEGEVG